MKKITVGHKYVKKDGSEGINWSDIGLAFEKDGGRLMLSFHAAPLDLENDIIMVSEIRKRQDTQQAPNYDQSQGW